MLTKKKMASIRKVVSVQPIDGADAIEYVSLGDRHVVAEKGKYQVDDFCVYFEIGAIVPNNIPALSFMKRVNFKVIARTFMGKVSEGMCWSVDILPSGTKLEDGIDVTEALGVKNEQSQTPEERKLRLMQEKLEKAKADLKKVKDERANRSSSQAQMQKNINDLQKKLRELEGQQSKEKAALGKLDKKIIALNEVVGAHFNERKIVKHKRGIAKIGVVEAN
jgi:hypothetical protein